MDVGGIFDKDVLTQQQGFHLAVFACSSQHKHVLMEKVVFETHAGANKGRGKSQTVMGLAKKGVVDFFTDTVKYGHVVVGILGATVALDGLITRVT